METRKKIHVRKDDTVVVISGKDKGKQGKVTAVLTQKGRVVVEGINLVKKHTKADRRVLQGGILDMEAPIHASNVMLLEKIEQKKKKKNG